MVQLESEFGDSRAELSHVKNFLRMQSNPHASPKAQQRGQAGLDTQNPTKHMKNVEEVLREVGEIFQKGSPESAVVDRALKLVEQQSSSGSMESKQLDIMWARLEQEFVDPPEIADRIHDFFNEKLKTQPTPSSPAQMKQTPESVAYKNALSTAQVPNLGMVAKEAISVFGEDSKEAQIFKRAVEIQEGLSVPPSE